MTTSLPSNHRIQVSFADFEDLTTRLVLLPRIEDEGIGAVIASYTEANSKDANNPVIESASSDSTECRDEKEHRLEVDSSSNANNENKQHLGNCNNLEGLVLVGDGEKDLKNADFASILSAMRGQPGPIVLELEPAPIPASSEPTSLRHDKSSSSSSGSESSEDYSSEEESSTTNGSIHEEEASRDAQNAGVPAIVTSPTTSVTTNNISNRFAAWGSRMRASAQQAAEAASQAYEAAQANRVAALKANEEYEKSSSSSSSSPPPVAVHVQTSLGAFLPLTTGGNHSPRSSELAVTSTSVLYIRKSAVEACPPRGYTFQWYKGLPDVAANSPIEEWIALPSATHAAFQPSTTEVGYRLLCRVTVEKKSNPDSSLMDSDSESDEEADDKEETPDVFRCVTPSIVAADLSLFNGARQALVRGAHFGGLVGKGNAQGRTFRVQVEMGYQHHKSSSSSSKKRVASSVKVDQVSGETAEPLHEDPFYRVSANTSHGNSKSLELKFRRCDLNDPSLMSALVSSEGVLELVAPNRFARESLLLAIGIANFKGKPADLDATTILYPPPKSDDDGTPLEESFSEDSCSSSGSAGSCSYSTAPERSAPTPKHSENLTTTTTLPTAAGLPQQHEAPNHGRQPSFDSAGDLSTIASVADSLVDSQVHAPPPEGAVVAAGPTARELELEQEVAFLRAKLAKKDKVVSEFQRHVTRSEAELQRANQEATNCQQKVAKLESEMQSSQRVQKAAEQMVDQHVATMKTLKQEHAQQLTKLTDRIEARDCTIAELEKTVKSHQNEKAVLTAAVEARESKLAKVASLQEQFMALSAKVTQQEQWRKDLEETNQRYQELKADLQKATQSEADCRQELEATKATLQSVQEELQSSQKVADDCRSDLKSIQSKNQKLKSERNSYKQKADSLSKEIARICRNGRTLADVERTLANEEARNEEVQLLRKQKRKALEECHSYRKSYEQARAAQELLSQSNAENGGKVDPSNAIKTAKLMERNVELERLVTDLTEYVNAKEMQLETMKEVNTALQEEIHGLAQANMQKNDI